MTARPDLSVIIVTHNGREMALTDPALGAGRRPGRPPWSGSSSTRARPTARPTRSSESSSEVRVLRRDNRGFAASNNVALARRGGATCCSSTQTSRFAPERWASSSRRWTRVPALGLASVVQRGTDGELQPSIRRFPSPLRSLGESLFAAHWPVLRTLQELETRAARYEHEGQAEWLVGAFLIARREAVQASRTDGRALLPLLGGDRLVLPLLASGLAGGAPADDGRHPPLRAAARTAT